MRATYHRRRLADFVGAARLARGACRARALAARAVARVSAGAPERDRPPRGWRRSPFHRARLAGLQRGDPVELERLPVLEKDEMMERFDELVTDRRLRRDEILARLEGLEGLERDELHLGALPRHDDQRLLGTQGPVRVRPRRLALDRRPVPALQRACRHPSAAAATDADRGDHGRRAART